MFFVTGAAGFIGSHLVDALLASGEKVTGWDNFSTGRSVFLQTACSHPDFRLVEGDNLDLPGLARAMQGCDHVVHFAANADVRFGIEHPSKDFDQNTRATFHVLEAMRMNGIRNLAFSSTGSVYGEAKLIPTPEDHPFPMQTSLYGASKLAGEGMIQAYCEGFGMRALIFRFVSILGPRYTHGHVFDFCRQLLDHPEYLSVLGDGTQRKSYLHVTDCIAAVTGLMAADRAVPAKRGAEVFNLGTDDYCTVQNSVGWICARLGLSPELRFGAGDRGWIGDNPFIYLETGKIRSTGWVPTFGIRQSVEATVDWLGANTWVFDNLKAPS